MNEKETSLPTGPEAPTPGALSPAPDPRLGPSLPRARVPLSWVGAMVIALLVSLVVSTAAIKVYHDQFALKIVAMDVSGYIKVLRDQAIEGKLPREDVEKLLDQLEAQILNQPPGTVILLEEVVVTKGLAQKINPVVQPQ